MEMKTREMNKVVRGKDGEEESEGGEWDKENR